VAAGPGGPSGPGRAAWAGKTGTKPAWHGDCGSGASLGALILLVVFMLHTTTAASAATTAAARPCATPATQCHKCSHCEKCTTCHKCTNCQGAGARCKCAA
jgi:hypothetical protein